LVSSRLKKQFEGWFATRVGVLTSLGMTPNTITLMGLIASLAAAGLYLNWRMSKLMLPSAAALILLSGFFDALDGVLARSLGRTTAFGGFLDSVSDRYSDVVVLVAIVVAGLCNVAWGLAAVVGSLMVSYTRARAEAMSVGMAAVGLAERAERMLILATATFVAFFWMDALGWGMIILAVLSHLTVIQRSVHFYRETNKR